MREPIITENDGLVLLVQTGKPGCRVAIEVVQHRIIITDTVEPDHGCLCLLKPAQPLDECSSIVAPRRNDKRNVRIRVESHCIEREKVGKRFKIVNNGVLKIH